MAEFNFFISDSERDGLLVWILEQGAQLIPDAHYRQPEHSVIKSSSQLADWPRQHHFWIIRSDWQIEPLQLMFVDQMYLGPGYYINPRHGGPALQLLLASGSSTAKPAFVLEGMIQHYPFYYSLESANRLLPSEGLRGFFAEFAKRIKKGGARLRVNKATRWISRAAIDSVLAGTARLGNEWSAAFSQTMAARGH